MKRIIIALATAALATLCFAQGKGMTILRNTTPPQRTPIADIDSLTYYTGSPAAVRVHHGSSVLATNLTDVDSIIFGDLPPYEVMPSGAFSYDVSQSRIRYLNFGSVSWGPNWAWFGMDGTESVSMDNERTVTGSPTIGGTGTTLNVTHRARALSRTEFELTFDLTVSATVTGAYIVEALSLAQPYFRWGVVYGYHNGAVVDTSQTSFPLGGSGMNNTFDSLRAIDNNGDTTAIIFDHAIGCYTDGGFRVTLNPTGGSGSSWTNGTMNPGTTYSTTIRVRLPDELSFYPSLTATYQYGKTADWFAFSSGDSGSPVDLSFLNKDAGGAWIPAGGHGFLRAQADSFVFADNTPGRFWGVNVTAYAAKGTNARCLQIAERLARLGVNVVRLHHLDSWWAPSCIDVDAADNTTQHLDSVNMDRLDRIIYELKAHGIYVVLDPWVGRQFNSGDSVPGYVDMTGNFGLHPYVYFDQRIQHLTQVYWQQIWTHRNAYTGVVYKDEPAIILTEVINEGLTGGPSLEPYRTNYLNMYKAWARSTGVDTNHNPINNNYDRKSIDFYMHYTDSFYTAMRTYLRGIGVQVPITFTNWSFWNWEPPVLQKADFMDMHHYYGGDVVGAGNEMGGIWTQHSIFTGGGPWGKIAKHAVYGKPLMSSECGQNPPKIYRGAYYASFAAVSCLQGWDCITGYAYTQGGSPARQFSGQFLSAYDWECDPVTLAGLAAGALIYRRQDVRPAQQTVVMRVPTSEYYQLHWQNGGEQATENLPKFNAMLETHRVVCVYGDTVPAALAAADAMDVNTGFNYNHPSSELRSDTDELWRDWDKGAGTISTPRTQSAFGRMSGQTYTTRSCSFVINNPYASVVLSSLTSDSIPASGKLLLMATGEAKNTGMAYDLLRTRVTVTGVAPIVAESITGTVSFRTSKASLTLYPLSPSGVRKAGVAIPVVSGNALVELKAEYQALCYEIE